MIRATRLFAASLAMFVGSAALATEAKIEKTHLCCASCVKGVEKAVGTVKGATVACDKAAGTVTITAADEATAQKAVDAVFAAGYFGSVTGAKAPAEDAAGGKATSATVSGVHNCCKKCTTAINGAISKTQGAKGEIAAKATDAKVTGDFDSKALGQSLHDAGFNAKVESK